MTADVPAQQLAAARLRAAESGRWLVLAGPTGPTAAVDPAGAVQARSRLEEQTVVESRIRPRTGRTPYAVLGDIPVLIVATAMAAGAHLGGARRRADRT